MTVPRAVTYWPVHKKGNRMTTYQILIAGGGAAGISLAASLKKRDVSLNIGIIEPSETHVYQPGQTLVGRGVMSLEQLKRPTQSFVPSGVDWIKASVTEFKPDAPG